VLAAELSAAVGTLERHEGFLPAHLTVHVGCSLFSMLKANGGLYVSPKIGPNIAEKAVRRLKATCPESRAL
jgi:hypothetical protein